MGDHKNDDINPLSPLWTSDPKKAIEHLTIIRRQYIALIKNCEKMIQELQERFIENDNKDL